jgi:hypothetical protein
VRTLIARLGSMWHGRKNSVLSGVHFRFARRGVKQPILRQ